MRQPTAARQRRYAPLAVVVLGLLLGGCGGGQDDLLRYIDQVKARHLGGR